MHKDAEACYDTQHIVCLVHGKGRASLLPGPAILVIVVVVVGIGPDVEIRTGRTFRLPPEHQNEGIREPARQAKPTGALA